MVTDPPSGGIRHGVVHQLGNGDADLLGIPVNTYIDVPGQREVNAAVRSARLSGRDDGLQRFAQRNDIRGRRG